MTTKAKWFLKQYWRAGAIRSIFGVLLGMFILGRYYYPLIPILNELDPSILGAILLAGFLLLLFLGIGFLYDAKLQLWNENLQVSVDRDPFTYVPYIRYRMMEYPFFLSLMAGLRLIAKKTGASTQDLDDLVEYLEFYYRLSPQIKDHLFGTPPVAQEYMSNHPFTHRDEVAIVKRGIGSRIKYKFQLVVWRLNWVQSFTGLGQDVLVFVALYIGILFPGAITPTGGVAFDVLGLGILFISLPLFLGLVALGWAYDKKLRLWSPDFAVKAERDPYSYVPDFRLIAFAYPFYYSLYSFLHEAQSFLGIQHQEMEDTIEFLHEYWMLSSSRDTDMVRARELRAELGSVWEPHEKTSSMEN